MSTVPMNQQRRPDRAALAIAASLVVLGLIIAWDASQLGAGGAYARIGPQTIPYVIALCLGG
ncbi:MAG TPA: tripartite tricarboxylate transporter TctB family protein, partial [Devosia sp.]